jgi:hypothetical protein
MRALYLIPKNPPPKLADKVSHVTLGVVIVLEDVISMFESIESGRSVRLELYRGVGATVRLSLVLTPLWCRENGARTSVTS